MYFFRRFTHQAQPRYGTLVSPFYISSVGGPGKPAPATTPGGDVCRLGTAGLLLDIYHSTLLGVNPLLLAYITGSRMTLVGFRSRRWLAFWETWWRGEG